MKFLTCHGVEEVCRVIELILNRDGVVVGVFRWSITDLVNADHFTRGMARYASGNDGVEDRKVHRYIQTSTGSRSQIFTSSYGTPVR